MSKERKIDLNLVKFKTCKHSVRYNSVQDGSEKYITSIYILNDAFSGLEAPQKVIMTLILNFKD